MPSPGVLAVLVAHASGSWLPEALESIAAQNYDGLRLVVVRVGEVRVPELPGVVVVDVPQGTGFAGAVSRGLQAAAGDEPYLLFLHDDVRLSPDVIASLVERAQSEERAAAVGAKLIDWQDEEVLQEVGGALDRFATRRRVVEQGEVDHGQYDDARDVVYSSAACLLVDRAAYEAIGGLDENAWPLYEDVDLCWRLRAAGQRVVVAPAAKVRHAAAMSRGMRRSAGPAFGVVALAAHGEHGRLRFMLKNYQALALAFLLPQYLVLELFTALGALLRRDFWRIRSSVRAWTRVARELPDILQARRSAPQRTVDDDEILSLATRQAASARRLDRVAVFGAASEWIRRLEQQVATLAREPVAWATLAGFAVLVLMLRGVLFGGEFILGALRPLPMFGGALAEYTAATRVEGLDVAAPAGPGLLVLGAINSLPILSEALTQKLMLLGPLAFGYAGLLRLGRALGLRSGRYWLGVVGAVNPATLHLVRHGDLGPLVLFAAAGWLVTRMLTPHRTLAVRTTSIWCLSFALIVALHPPALPVIVLLWAAIAGGRAGDGLSRRRVEDLVVGCGAAFVVLLPWSLEWFRSSSPLVGRAGGFLDAARGLDAATFGAGWPLVVGLAAVFLVVGAVRTARLALTTGTALAVAYLAGGLGVLSGPTALATVAFCAVFLGGYVARTVSEDVPQYALGWRQVGVLTIGLLFAIAYAGAIVTAVAGGASVSTRVVAAPPREAVGRVLWLAPGASGTRMWATSSFERELHAWPQPSGPEMRLAERIVGAMADGSTHRAGTQLALLNVSHIVTLGGAGPFGLPSQADIVRRDVQGRAVVWANRGWSGPARLLASEPEQILQPAGLFRLSRGQESVTSSLQDGRIVVDVPPVEAPAGGAGDGADPGEAAEPAQVEPDGDEVLHLAVGSRRGWSIGSAAARPAEAGLVVDRPDAGRLEVSPPGGLRPLLRLLGALSLVVLIAAWMVAAYLAGPVVAPLERLQLQARGPRRWLVAGPALLTGGAAVVALLLPAAAAASQLSSANYCAPVGAGPAQRLAIVNTGQGPASYHVRPSMLGPPVASGELAAGDRTTLEVDAERGAVVESFGPTLHVATVVSNTDSSSTTTCPDQTHPTVYFAEGGRRQLFDRLPLGTTFVLHNPFPEEARAAVRLFTPGETIAPPAFQDILVEAGGVARIDPEDQLEPTDSMGAELRIWKGRAVVGRRLSRAGVVWWSSAVTLESSGVLARAVTAGAQSEIVAVNPGDDGSRLTVSLVGEEGSFPSVTVDVPSRGREAYDLADDTPEQASLLVEVTAQPPVALEAIVVPEGRSDASIVPVGRAARRLVLPAAEGRRAVVTNPGTGDVRVEFRRLGPGPVLPAVVVGAGRTQIVELPGETPFGVELLTRGGPVVAMALGGAGSYLALPVD